VCKYDKYTGMPESHIPGMSLSTWWLIFSPSQVFQDFQDKSAYFRIFYAKLQISGWVRGLC